MDAGSPDRRNLGSSSHGEQRMKSEFACYTTPEVAAFLRVYALNNFKAMQTAYPSEGKPLAQRPS